MRFGADIRFVQFNSRQDRNYRPLIEVNNGLLRTLQGTGGDNPYSGVAFLPGFQFANLGQVSSIFQTITSGTPNSQIGLRFAEVNLFINENWRVRPNLALDFGLRYEFNSTPREVHRRIENALTLQDLPAAGRSRFDSTAATLAFNQSVDVYGDIVDGRETIYQSDHNNFGPHFGFAWDPFKTGRTAVRAGYGVYYDTILGAVVSQSRNVFPTEIPFLSDGTFFGQDGISANNPSFFGIDNDDEEFLPFLVGQTNQLAGSPEDFVALVGRLFDATKQSGGLTFTLPEKQLRTPQVQQWHLTLEREIFGDYLISAAYVGTRGVNLTRRATPNGGRHITPNQVIKRSSGSIPEISYETSDQDISIQLPIQRSNAALGPYQTFQNSASSSYHALQLELIKRYSKGLSLRSAYTWSHAIDEVSDVIDTAGSSALPQDSKNLAAERGDAGFDVRHRSVTSLILDLPSPKGATAGSLLGGWQIATVLNIHTGQPFTLSVPFDANLDGNLTDRPTTVEGLTFFSGHDVRRVEMQPGSSVTDFYVVNQNGQVGRNTVRTDSFINWDFALRKRFKVTDSSQLQLSTEFFNLLNRANFDIPVRTIGNPGFGSSVNTASPARTIQIALKWVF